MDNMDLAVRSPRKAAKFNHSLPCNETIIVLNLRLASENQSVYAQKVML